MDAVYRWELLEQVRDDPHISLFDVMVGRASIERFQQDSSLALAKLKCPFSVESLLSRAGCEFKRREASVASNEAQSTSILSEYIKAAAAKVLPLSRLSSQAYDVEHQLETSVDADWDGGIRIVAENQNSLDTERQDADAPVTNRSPTATDPIVMRPRLIHGAFTRLDDMVDYLQAMQQDWSAPNADKLGSRHIFEYIRKRQQADVLALNRVFAELASEGSAQGIGSSQTSTFAGSKRSWNGEVDDSASVNPAKRRIQPRGGRGSATTSAQDSDEGPIGSHAAMDLD